MTKMSFEYALAKEKNGGKGRKDRGRIKKRKADTSGPLVKLKKSGENTICLCVGSVLRWILTRTTWLPAGSETLMFDFSLKGSHESSQRETL